jgi:hypothetical protein
MKRALAIAATAVAALLLTALPAHSAPDDTLQVALSALTRIGQSSHSGQFERAGQPPVQFTHEAPGRFRVTEGPYDAIGYDGHSYTSFDSVLAARAVSAGLDQLHWYTSPDSQEFGVDVPELVSALFAGSRHATVTRSASTLVAVIRFSEVTRDDTLLYGLPSTGRYVLRLDDAGRIIRIDSTETFEGDPGEPPVRQTSTLRLSYGAVTVTPPPTRSVITLVGTSDLPVLSPLAGAAYSTAETAAAIGAGRRGGVTLDVLDEAAAAEASPPGLVASYIPGGLRYELDGAALCITVTTPALTANVSPCA